MPAPSRKQKPKTKPQPAQEPSIACAYDEVVPLSKLKPNPRNPNQHPKPQLKLLGSIIRKTGWRSPIVVSTRSGYITKGHGRYLAALQAGFTVAPVDKQDYPSAAAEIADMVADNRLAELAEMDTAILKDLLEEIDDGQFDMDLTGFDAAALEALMLQVHQEEGKDAEPQMDKAAELNKQWKVKAGDLWLVGEHRLLCGDSTKADAVARVLGTEKGLKEMMMVTDPPYGVEYDPTWRIGAGLTKQGQDGEGAERRHRGLDACLGSVPGRRRLRLPRGPQGLDGAGFA
jgi:hypothetical protein